jgi:hypothetical protein
MKYYIGIIGAIAILVSALSLGYRLSYQIAMERQEALAAPQELHIQTVQATTDAIENDGYYICESHGYLIVYLADKETVFEITTILLDSLPSEVQMEVKDGKYVETEGALYSFLQNYST